jgi:hypothetical protein
LSLISGKKFILISFILFKIYSLYILLDFCLFTFSTLFFFMRDAVFSLKVMNLLESECLRDDPGAGEFDRLDGPGLCDGDRLGRFGEGDRLGRLKVKNKKKAVYSLIFTLISASA